MADYLNAVLAVLSTVLAAIAAYVGVDYLLSSPSRTMQRASRRVRGLGAEDGDVAGEFQRVSLLLRLASMSSSGWQLTVAKALVGLAVKADSKGIRQDAFRLRQAGVLKVLSADDMLRVRAFTGFVLCALLAVGNLEASAIEWVAFTILGFVLGVRMPGFTLASAASSRQEEVLRSLPEMIDMIALASRAGLGFDQALIAYCNRFDTPLAREFAKAEERWRLGAATRDDGLAEVADSLEVDAVRRFVSAVQQSLRLGSPLAGVLEEQAAEARTAHRLALQEKIAKAPVKMLMPMGGLILPAMLLILVGPMVLQMGEGMSGF